MNYTEKGAGYLNIITIFEVLIVFITGNGFWYFKRDL